MKSNVWLYYSPSLDRIGVSPDGMRRPADAIRCGIRTTIKPELLIQGGISSPVLTPAPAPKTKKTLA